MFIKRAVKLVNSKFLLGVLLSVGVLWWFLRIGRGTLLIAVSIPISLLTTFIVLQLTGAHSMSFPWPDWRSLSA